MKLLIATKNPSKAKEIKSFLGESFELVTLADFKDTPNIEETGNSFN